MRINKRSVVGGFIATIILNFCIIASVVAQTGNQTDIYPYKVGYCDVDVTYDLYVEGDYAYVSTNDGIVIIDLQNPIEPQKIGNIDIDDGAFGIVVNDGIAFIAGDSSGFVIADLNDPRNPIKLGQYTNGGNVIDVAISGDFAYITDTKNGLEILNISDLSNPIKVGQFNAVGWSHIYVSENIAYYGDNSGLKVFNVSDPSFPQLINYQLNMVVFDIYVHEDLLFIASHQYGVRIYNISDPRTLVHLGQFTEVGESYGVSGNATHLYVADVQEGVQLLDISDPIAPKKVGEYTDTAPHDIFYRGECVYIAAIEGFLILEFRSTPITTETRSITAETTPTTTETNNPLSFDIYLFFFGILSFLAISKRKTRKRMDE